MQRGVIDAVLATRHAGTRKVRLAYELAGDPETPVAFIAGGISADRHVAANAADPSRGWAEGLFDTGRALDPAGCRLLAFDYIGADGGIDAPIDTADQADCRRSPGNPRQGHAGRPKDRTGAEIVERGAVTKVSDAPDAAARTLSRLPAARASAQPGWGNSMLKSAVTRLRVHHGGGSINTR